MNLKKLIMKLKEIETIIDLNIGKELTEDTATDVYQITNELIGGIKKLPIISVGDRELYTELRSFGLTDDNCEEVLDWIETLYNYKKNEFRL